MADQLLFRGGNTASVAGSTVSNREIVIDTQTNQIVLGSAKKRTAMEGDDVSFEGIVATNPRSSTAASGSGGLTIHPSDTTAYYNFRVDSSDNELRIDTTSGADKVKFKPQWWRLFANDVGVAGRVFTTGTGARLSVASAATGSNSIRAIDVEDIGGQKAAKLDGSIFLWY